MGSVNKAYNFPGITTHGGTPAARITNEQLLRRSVLSCFLWEKEFYEDGVTIAQRITETSHLCTAEFVANLAIEARNVHGLRHVPLLLVLSLIVGDQSKRPKSDNPPRVIDVINAVIQRPDEMTELLAMYWLANGGRKQTAKLSKQLQRGLAKAFTKFDGYQLAKYNRDGPIKLRDVLFLSHAKPLTKEKEELFKQLVDGKLPVPDTWETELSAGKDKKETFERLIRENKLGYLALLRNLRNMRDAGCDDNLIKNAIRARKGAKFVLPFRYTAAARQVPQFETAIDHALMATIKEIPPLSGRTVVLVDVSGSMDWQLSQKSDLKRIDAAATLASIINAESLRVFSFSKGVVEVPPRRGMAGVDAIIKSQSHLGTELANAVRYINNSIKHDRLIVITDEQATGYARIPDPVCEKAYMINVASNRNGVGYNKWIHIDGFSEAVIKYIMEIENAV